MARVQGRGLLLAVVAALALALAPAAQAKPVTGPVGGPNDVSPIIQSIQAANAAKILAQGQGPPPDSGI